MIRLGLGEGPLWHPLTNRLYVTDIYHRVLHIFDADLTRLHTHVLERLTSAMTWQMDGSLLLFHDRGGISRWQEGKHEVLIDSLPGEQGSRFNDVIADPLGRVLCGTEPVGTRPGRLYSIGRDLQPRVLIEEVQEPNGLGFSPDRTQLYFTDSVAQTIWRFPYDAATGRLGTREEFFRTRNDDVLPDGLTVDIEGNVWTALWNGGGVLRISPDGKSALKYPVPALRSTSLTFGGARFQTLFVTSARDHGDTLPKSLDGALFAIDGCGAGRAEFPSRLGE